MNKLRNDSIVRLDSGKNIPYFYIGDDINGNARYIIHYSNLINTNPEPIDYNKVLDLAKQVNGNKYRGNLTGFVVFKCYQFQLKAKIQYILNNL